MKQVKKCSQCGEEKSIDEFGKNRNKPDGKQYACRQCASAKHRESRIKAGLPVLNLKPKVEAGYKYCTGCGSVKPMADFGSSCRSKDGVGIHCLSCHKAYRVTVPPERKVWAWMRSRCNSPSNYSYSLYGGRGVKVCARWNSFDNFLQDMGARPSPRHQIDRINNAGDYEPSNCRWVLPETNAQNRRSTKLNVDAVRDIRNNCGATQDDVEAMASKYNVSISCIKSVRYRHTWKNI